MSLRKLCRTAEAAGIVLLIENHPGTLTVTGMDTARMVADVASPTLRVLYDPANVLCHSAEDAWHTFEVQKEVIAYVHVKDFRIDGGERVACPVGQGCVPWAEIIAWIRAARRDVPFSLEYERKWNRTQLPPPEIGLAASLAHLRTLLCQTPGAGVG